MRGCGAIKAAGPQVDDIDTKKVVDLAGCERCFGRVSVVCRVVKG